jgi:hypothetical protein
MFNCNPAWKDLKIGEVMRLLEQNGVHHANPNDLKHRIQGFIQTAKQELEKVTGSTSKCADMPHPVQAGVVNSELLLIGSAQEGQHGSMVNHITVQNRLYSSRGMSLVKRKEEKHFAHIGSPLLNREHGEHTSTEAIRRFSSKRASDDLCEYTQTEYKVSTCTVRTLTDHTDTLKARDTV